MNALTLGTVVAFQVAAVGVPTLSIDQALKMTVQNQPQLLQARQVTRVYAAMADQSRAGLLPQVVATAEVSGQTANVALRPGTIPSQYSSSTVTNSPKPYPYYTAALSATQLVFDFGSTYGLWRSAKATTESYRETEKATLNSVTLTTRTSFFAAWYQKALVKVQVETLDDQLKHLEQTKGFLKAGTNSQLDMVLAQTNVASAKLNLINAQNSYLTAKATLNQAMGVEGSIEYDIADDEFGPVEGEELNDDQLLATAMAARPDLRNLQWNAEAYTRAISAQKAAYAPSLSVSANTSESGGVITNLAWNYTVAGTLTWNIFQGGITKAAVDQAEANLGSVQAQMSTLRLQIRLGIVQARLAINNAKASIIASQEVTYNAREQLRLAEKQYQAGVGIMLAIQDAQVSLTTALSSEAQARYNLFVGRSQLINALGKP